jgi:hypothetical protein
MARVPSASSSSPIRPFLRDELLASSGDNLVVENAIVNRTLFALYCE